MKLNNIYDISYRSGEQRSYTITINKDDYKELPEFFSNVVIVLKKNTCAPTTIRIEIYGEILEEITFDAVGEHKYEMIHFRDVPYPYITHPNFGIIYEGEIPLDCQINMTEHTEATFIPLLIKIKRPAYKIKHGDFAFMQFGKRVLFVNEVSILDPIRPEYLTKDDIVIECIDFDKIIQSWSFTSLRYKLLIPIIGMNKMKLLTSGKFNVCKSCSMYITGPREEMLMTLEKLMGAFPKYSFHAFNGSDNVVSDLHYRSLDAVKIISRILRKK